MTGRADLRLGITDVAPVVSCGSFSARAVVGEHLPITATVFREGHDAVAANVVWRGPDGGENGPLLRMAPEELGESMLKKGSDDQLKFINPVAMYEVEKIDVSIGIWADENTKALTNVDPKRMGMSQAARKPMMEVFMRRAAEGSLKWCGTQFPCQASAQDAEMSLSEYEDFVFSAGLLDRPDPVAAWRAVSEKQQRLTDLLNERSSAGRGDYQVVAANGTDLRLSVAGRKWINCDGHENFPDGEVFSGPVLDSDTGSRFLGECAIGTNYDITRYTRNTLFDEKIGGTVHFALGAGYPETGNANQSGLHWDMVVDLRQGGHIEIDGVRINEDGRFTREGFPGGGG